MVCPPVGPIMQWLKFGYFLSVQADKLSLKTYFCDWMYFEGKQLWHFHLCLPSRCVYEKASSYRKEFISLGAYFYLYYLKRYHGPDKQIGSHKNSPVVKIGRKRNAVALHLNDS